MAEESAREAMEKSRSEVIECEEEIKNIKNGLRALSSSSAPSSNRLEVSVLSVSGGSTSTSTVKPTTFKIHLSSPIEERTLTKLYDPLNTTASSDEVSIAIFTSLESSNALLTVEAYHHVAADGGDTTTPSLLGSSAPHDLQPLCRDTELWRNGGDGKKVSSLDVAIVASADTDGPESPATTAEAANAETNESSSESWEDAADEEGDGNAVISQDEGDDVDELDAGGEGKDDSTAGDVVIPKKNGAGARGGKTEGTASVLLLSLCTVTLRIAYYPSAEDRRDALYDRLNEVSKRKVAAIEDLRRSAGIVNRARASAEEATSGSGSGGGGGGPAVKSGFLNKTSKGAAVPSSSGDNKSSSPPFWKRWYDRTIGPRSMLWVVGPVAMNYVLFAGASLFLHYKGDLLALPPPV